MFAGPAIILALIKLSGAASLVVNGDQILLISMLAAAAPVANMISMFAQLYGKDAEYASTITTLTTLSCIVTMPVFVYLYGL
jgi:predicted permease